jgi:predicted nucleic acid-binding protein
VRFWDSSAIVPLILTQPRSAEARASLAADAEVVVWWNTQVECASAIARLQRDGHLPASDERVARELLDVLRRSWFEIQPGDGVREQALRLLRLHPLRAADALQLAAAIEWAGTPPAGILVTFDDRLRDAAQREGFATG